MFDVKFISNCLMENVDDIKIAALYYDKINIMENDVYTINKPKVEMMNGKKRVVSTVRGTYNCLTGEFSSNLKMLEDEGIIDYFESNDYTIEPANSNQENEIPELMKVAMQNTSYLLRNSKKQLWYEKISGNNLLLKLDPEVKAIHKKFVGELKVGSKIDLEFIYNYYRNLLSYLLFYISVGETTITSSKLIDNYINNIYIDALNKNVRSDYDIKKYGLPKIYTDTIRLFLPDVSKMPIEDILELRVKLKDELEGFRYFSLKLSKEIQENFDYKDIICDTQRCVEITLKPAINELTQKLKGMKLNIASKFIDELRNPKTYAPLVGSIFLNLPSHLTTLLSLGLAGSKVAIESYKEFSELKQNGLYYLIKLRDNTV